MPTTSVRNITTMTSLRRRRAAFAATLLSATLALTACNGNPGSGEPETGAPTVGQTTTAEATAAQAKTVDADNGTIEVAADPQRVVTLGSATVPYIDLGGAPVGATELSGFLFDKLSAEQQAAYGGATIVGTSAGEVDLEKIASLEPDLILMFLQQEDYDAIATELQAIAPTVFFSLATDGTTAAAGMAKASNKEVVFGEQKNQFEEKVAAIKGTYSELIASTAFVNLNRWAATEPGMFVVDNSGCAELAVSELGITLPELADDAAFEARSFEQLAELSQYDAILYPVDKEGQVQVDFEPVVETNTWQALPAVEDGRALGVFCASNSSYGLATKYLDSVEAALAALSAKE